MDWIFNYLSPSPPANPRSRASAAKPQPKIGISRAKAQRPQRKKCFPNLAFLASWRENNPKRLLLKGQKPAVKFAQAAKTLNYSIQRSQKKRVGQMRLNHPKWDGYSRPTIVTFVFFVVKKFFS